MPQRFWWALGLILVLSIFYTRRGRKARDASWKGVVTRIEHERPELPEDQRRPEDWLTVGYQTEAGQAGSFRATVQSIRQFLPGLSVGDALVKQPGNYLPRRANLAAAASPSPQAGQTTSPVEDKKETL